MGFLEKFSYKKDILRIEQEQDRVIVAYERALDIAQKLAMDAVKKTKFLPDQERKSMFRKLRNIQAGVYSDEIHKFLFQEKEIPVPAKELQSKMNEKVLEDIRNILFGEGRVPVEFVETRETILNQVKEKLKTL